MADLLSDRYLLTTPLGEGGFSSVYKATDTLLDREVAVKILKSEISRKDGMVERFLREAKLTASLKHTHSLQIFDYGHNEDQLYIVSELLNGQTLDQILEEQGAFTEAWICEYFVPLCLALHEAHEAGIIHRDLKPSNLFLHSWGQDTRLILIDFGISKIETNEISKVTKTGELFGTPHYMSPEQIQKPDQLEASSDLYSLGIILFELISGSPPFNGETIYELLSHHIGKEAPLLSDLTSHCSSSFAALVKELLHKIPNERPPSALEVAQRLKALQKTQITSTEPFFVNSAHAGNHTSTLSSAINPDTSPTLDHVDPKTKLQAILQANASNNAFFAYVLIAVTVVFTAIFLYFRNASPTINQKITTGSERTFSGSVSPKSKLERSPADQSSKYKTKSSLEQSKSAPEQTVEINSATSLPPTQTPKQKTRSEKNISPARNKVHSNVGQKARSNKTNVKKTSKKRRIRHTKKSRKRKKPKVLKIKRRMKPNNRVRDSVNMKSASFKTNKKLQPKTKASLNTTKLNNNSPVDSIKPTENKSTKQSPNSKSLTLSMPKATVSPKANQGSSLNSSGSSQVLTKPSSSESVSQSSVEKSKEKPKANPPIQAPRPPVGF